MRHIKVYEGGKFNARRKKRRANPLLDSLGCLTTMAGFGGVLFWGLTTGLHDMTVHDCEINKIQAACEELKK